MTTKLNTKSFTKRGGKRIKKVNLSPYSLLLQYLWKRLGGPKIVANHIGEVPQVLHNWTLRGHVPLEKVGRISRKLKVSPYALNYKQVLEFIGHGPQFKTVEKRCHRRRLTTVLTLLSALFVALPLVAHAIDEGQDYLALQHPLFKSAVAVKFIAPGTSIGLLDNTFGVAPLPIRTALNSEPKYLRVHIFNGPCIRANNCGSYEPSKGYSKASWDKAIKAKNKKILDYFRHRVSFYKQLSIEYPNTKFLLSPELEHDLSKASYRVLADTALEVWPEVQLVNSPVGGISIEPYKGAWIERHGPKPQADADIVSLDGMEITDIDIKAFKKRTEKSKIKIRFVWSRVYNCRANGPFIDPRKRTFCPTAQNFELLAHILDTRPPLGTVTKPVGCTKTLPFAAPRIWKPFADDHGINDKRANKPVVLIKSKVPKLEILAINGDVVGTLPLYEDSAPHTMERYYSGWKKGSNVSGYVFEKTAKNLTGSPWVWVKAGSTCLEPIIPGIRNGLYK